MGSTFWLILFGYSVGYIWSSIPFTKIWNKLRRKSTPIPPDYMWAYRFQKDTQIDLNAITDVKILPFGVFPGLCFTRNVSWKRLGNGAYEILVTYESLPKKEVS